MIRGPLRSLVFVLAAACLALPAWGQQPDGKAAPKSAGPLKTDKDKWSYSIGLDIGRNFKRQGIEVELGALQRGMRDAISGAHPLLTDEEMQHVMTAFREQMAAQHAKLQQAVGDKNGKEGAAFLVQNKGKDGVKTTASGLQYKVIKDGTGKSPTIEDTVTAHYRGTLLDGTEFDSSYKRGEPASFQVAGVIPGWTEMLQLMKVGSKVMVWIPANLAYGERGAGNVIGPNATLTFEIELLDVKK